MSDRLKRTDKAQYETERMFAAERVAQKYLESRVGGQHGFVEDEDDERCGHMSAQMYGVEDARDATGAGGAWVCVRFYVPNLDIDQEIDS